MGILDQLIQANPANTRWAIAQELHHVRTKADGLEQTRAAIALDGSDPHLGDDFLERILQGREQVLQAFSTRQRPFLLRIRIFEGQAIADQPLHQIRMNGVRAEGHETGDIVALLDVARLDDEAATLAQALVAEIRMNAAEREQRRNRRQPVGERLLVGETKDVIAIMDGPFRFTAESM